MRTSRTHQPLTYDVRLPDEAQADALRYSMPRAVVNMPLPSCGLISTNLGVDRCRASLETGREVHRKPPAVSR